MGTGPLKLDYKTLAALPTTSLQKVNRVSLFLCCNVFTLMNHVHCIFQHVWNTVLCFHKRLVWSELWGACIFAGACVGAQNRCLHGIPHVYVTGKLCVTQSRPVASPGARMCITLSQHYWLVTSGSCWSSCPNPYVDWRNNLKTQD